jgi:hypothetical protein
MSQSETAPFTFVYLAIQTWMGNTLFYPISARIILFISQDLYSGNTNLSQHIEFISKDMATQGYIWLTSDLLKLFSNNKFSYGTWVHHLLLVVLHSRTDLTLIAPNRAMCLLSVECSRLADVSGWMGWIG